jgi:4-aminobutyrate--pyruvate transaminase
VPAAVAIETLTIYDEIDIVGHVREVGAHFQAELRRRFQDHPLVGEVRGIGLIGAVELVEDKAAKRNFDPSRKAGAKLVKLAEQHGLICRAMVLDSIGFSPPLIITRAEIDEMLDRFEKTLDDLAVQLRREAIAPVA